MPVAETFGEHRSAKTSKPLLSVTGFAGLPLLVLTKNVQSCAIFDTSLFCYDNVRKSMKE